jgi:hypothetical protein
MKKLGMEGRAGGTGTCENKYLVIFVRFDRWFVRSWTGQERNKKGKGSPSFVALLVLHYVPSLTNLPQPPSSIPLQGDPPTPSSSGFSLWHSPSAYFHLRDLVILGDHVAAKCRKGSRASCPLGYVYRGKARH